MKERELEVLKNKLGEIKKMGWVRNRRHGNVGGIGNTLEDLLDIAENNLQLPDFGHWEIKSQCAQSNSLLTLFHKEPNPRKARIVPQILIAKYGWPHQKAGKDHPDNERSFRQTINSLAYSSRGFRVNVDKDKAQVYINFNFSKIQKEHSEWSSIIKNNVGTNDIFPNPYWTFKEIADKLNEKLNSLIYVSAQKKSENGEEYFKYTHIEAYLDPTVERFIDLLEKGIIYVDFDARTGHNHGTKFRIRKSKKTDLYNQNIII